METTELYKEIVDRMPGGFFVYHADGNEEIIHANQAMVRIFGCETMEEFIEYTGNTFKGIVHPDDLEQAEKSIHEQIENSQYAVDYLEYRIIKKDGTIRWVEDYGHFLHTENFGDIFYVFIDDATDRFNERMKHLEKVNDELRKLYDTESRYKKALIHDATVYFEVNLTRDMLLKDAVKVVNDRPFDYFKAKNMDRIDKYSEFIDKAIDMEGFENAEDCKWFADRDRIIRCYENGSLEQSYEGWVENPSGVRRLLSCVVLIGSERDTDDLMALFIIRDLTDLAEGKNLLKLALERADATKNVTTNYLSNMSHEINNPLNAILGYINIIERMKNVNPDVLKYISKIKNLSAQVLSVANGSLEYTKLEQGRADLCEIQGSISKNIDDLKHFIVPLSNAKDITFVSDTSLVKNDVVIADFVKLKNVIYKLLDNALKFTNSGGTIKLSVIELENRHDSHAKYQFIVEDNGIGIDEQFMDKMFQPFVRDHESMQGGAVGSGFGLAVARGIVNLMDGTINAESKLGEGSKFTVTVTLKIVKA